jgi:hypothetical protein
MIRESGTSRLNLSAKYAFVGKKTPTAVTRLAVIMVAGTFSPAF